ncbi:MAG: Crp/Fnr family transcriptional regulator [Spirochaetia bacterium]
MKINKEVFQKYVVTASAGKYIFYEDEPGSLMYIIIDGEIEIIKYTAEGSSKTLTTLKNGDIFGEMALIEKKARSASARAVRETRLLVLNEALFYNMIESNPDFARKMIRALSERIRRANTMIQSLTINSQERRLYTAALEYAPEKGIPYFKGWRVVYKDFIEWAANHIGLPSDDIQDLLRKLLKKGLIAPASASNEEFLVEKRRLSEFNHLR